jgi:predicted enzyme related to lactoylglutathione lyase
MTTAKFVWFDLNSKDAKKAETFYTELFGWKVQAWKPEGAPKDMPEYRMTCIGEQSFGGVNQLPKEAPIPSHWMGHVEVDDLDAAMKRAERLKASFPMGVMEVPTVGRMGMMMDPQGCAVSLFEPQDKTPTIPGRDQHGMVGWCELIAADAQAAKTFYSEVVGWKWRNGPFQDQMEYYLFGTGEEGGDEGGMTPKTKDMPVAAWFLYFTTKNIADTVAKVEKLGGKVHMKPFEVPTVGQLAICEGTDGSMFGVAQWAPQG